MIKFQWFPALLILLLLCDSSADINTPIQKSFKPIQQRIADRDFPSVFMAWARASKLPELSKEENIAKHDLAFMGTQSLSLKWDHEWYGLAERFADDSVEKARAVRKKLQAINPNLIVLAEIRYRDAWGNFMPEDHAWWKRDADGQRSAGWEEGGFYLMDFSNPQYQMHVAKRAKAVIDSGAADGIMLDWWNDDEDRQQLIKTIRHEIGEEALILANANDRQTPKTAPYINGYFMECYRSKTLKDWRRISDTLVWAKQNLREPRINCVEVWYEKSRQDLHIMRAVTCMTLALSDGYCLFSDPNDLPSGDHQHDWYPFWEKSLGKAVSEGIPQKDDSIRREFEKGTVVYNPIGNDAVTVSFDEPRMSVSSKRVSKQHTIAGYDGGIFTKAIEN